MDLFIDPAGPVGVGRQLYEQLRDGITGGRLTAGDQLLPSRELAARLGLSRHTVTTAYGRLAAEGYIEGRAGGGSFVAVGTPVVDPAARPAALTPTPRYADWSPLAGMPADDVRYNLCAGIPDQSLLPADEWRRLTSGAAGSRLAWSSDPAGAPGLREAIARWVGRSRGVVAVPDAVVVTNGAQHAIDLVCRVLVQPGDVVAVEQPGYHPVRRLLSALGVHVVGVPVDAEGLVVAELPAAARAVYVTPSHQFPLGVVMSAARRRALLGWADAHRAAVIEDDYDSEFRHVDRPLEPLQRLDEHGRVVYVGSFSKTLSPQLRLGFAVLPHSLVGAVTALRQVSDGHPPTTSQLALASFIDAGLLDRHIRRARRVYSERHRLVSAALRGPLAGALTPVPSSAGLHVAAYLSEYADEDAVRTALAYDGVATTGLQRYYDGAAARPGLVIGFGGIAAADLPGAFGAVRATLARLHLG